MNLGHATVVFVVSHVYAPYRYAVKLCALHTVPLLVYLPGLGICKAFVQPNRGKIISIVLSSAELFLLLSASLSFET